jgi:ketosteroid isomerase-like protein
MSEENLAALKRLYERLAAGDLQAGADLFDRCFVFISDPGDLEGQVHYGLDAFTAYMRRFRDIWEDMRFEAMDYREVENTFLVRVRRTGIGRQGGVPLDEEVFNLWTFQGAKAIRLEVLREEGEALKAAGFRK